MACLGPLLDPIPPPAPAPVDIPPPHYLTPTLEQTHAITMEKLSLFRNKFLFIISLTFKYVQPVSVTA